MGDIGLPRRILACYSSSYHVFPSIKRSRHRRLGSAFIGLFTGLSSCKLITNKAASNEAGVEDLMDEVSIAEQLRVRGKEVWN
jgi:hypothetical protein